MVKNTRLSVKNVQKTRSIKSDTGGKNQISEKIVPSITSTNNESGVLNNNKYNVSSVSTASQASTPPRLEIDRELHISHNVSLRASEMIDNIMQHIDDDCQDDSQSVATQEEIEQPPLQLVTKNESPPPRLKFEAASVECQTAPDNSSNTNKTSDNGKKSMISNELINISMKSKSDITNVQRHLLAVKIGQPVKEIKPIDSLCNRRSSIIRRSSKSTAFKSFTATDCKPKALSNKGNEVLLQTESEIVSTIESVFSVNPISNIISKQSKLTQKVKFSPVDLKEEKYKLEEIDKSDSNKILIHSTIDNMKEESLLEMPTTYGRKRKSKSQSVSIQSSTTQDTVDIKNKMIKLEAKSDPESKTPKTSKKIDVKVMNE